MVSILCRTSDPEAYPQLYTAPYMPTNPAYVLYEQYLLQGMRVGPWVGAVASIVPYFIARGRLPFYDRPSLMYRHFLYKGMITGLVGGIGFGACNGLYQLQQVYGLTDDIIAKHYRNDRAFAEKEMEVRVINDALLLRRNPTVMSWIATCSQFIMLSSLMTVLLYSKGGRLYRLTLGAAGGSMIASTLSATKLDLTLGNTMSQSAPSREKQGELMDQAAIQRSRAVGAVILPPQQK